MCIWQLNKTLLQLWPISAALLKSVVIFFWLATMGKFPGFLEHEEQRKLILNHFL